MPALNQTFEIPRAHDDPGGHIIIALTSESGIEFPSALGFNQALEDMIPVWSALQTRLPPSHAVALSMIFAEQAHFLGGQRNEDVGTLRDRARPVAS